MATNGNNLEPEFDALLKSHVKTNSATAVCDQFDPDTANAYLERALTKNAVTRYEAHLAGCPSCRRYLVELSRLMPAPTIAVETASVPPQTSLKERLTGWFSSWHLGLLAGLGAATATVLVIAVLVNRSGQEAMVATSIKSDQLATPQAAPLPTNSPATETATVDKLAKTAVSATPAATPGAEGKAADTAAIALSEQPQVAAAPVLPPALPAKTEEEREARKEVAANQANQVGQATSRNQQQNFRELELKGPAVNQTQQIERAGERSRQEPASAAGANAPAPAAKPAERPAEKDKQDEAKAVADARRDDAKKSADTEAQPKAGRSNARMSPAPMISKNERLARPTRNVAGKSFSLENGFWTDNDYEAAKGLSVVRLQHDSDAYKQTLKDLPGLKPYFDLTPVIVVWQGKVYRVEKK